MSSAKCGCKISVAWAKSFRAPGLVAAASFVATTSSSSATLSGGHTASAAAAAPAMGPSATSTITGDLAADMASRKSDAGGTAIRPGPATATRAWSIGFRTSAPSPSSAQTATNRTSSGSGSRCSKEVRSLATASGIKTPPSTMTSSTSAATWPSARCSPCSSHFANASATGLASRPCRTAARKSPRKVPAGSVAAVAEAAWRVAMARKGSAATRQSRGMFKTSAK
mmetsp:Transcript_16779/g.39335  ORF Transcript_16779/g.39335 Transcript_16779/m.39335 type:complete len:226 (+) Transcript_16779:1212-1889(+)